MNEDRKLAEIVKSRIEKEAPSELVVKFADDKSGTLVVSPKDGDEDMQFDAAALMKALVIALRIEQEDDKDEF